MAVRVDLPELFESDQAQLDRKITEISKAPYLKWSGTMCKEGWLLDNLWPWLARTEPHRLSAWVNPLRLKALQYKEPEHLLHFLAATEDCGNEQLRRQVSTAALQWGHRLAAEIKPSPCAQLITEVMVYCGDVDDLKVWFDYAATNAELRQSVSYYPNPQVISHLLPEAVTSHCRERLVQLVPGESEQVGEQILFWGTIVAASCHAPDGVLFEWAAHALSEAPDDRWILWTIAKAAGTATWFTDVLRVSPSATKQASRVVRQLLKPQELNLDELAVMQPAERWGELLPPDVAIQLFERLGRDDLIHSEIVRFLAAARQIARDLKEAHLVPGMTEFRLDESQRASSVGFDAPWLRRSVVFGRTVASAWGIDHATTDDLQQSFGNKIGAQFDEAFEKWRKYQDDLRNWKYYEVFAFSCRQMLSRWAKANHSEFLDFTSEYLELIRHAYPEATYRLGAFTDALQGALVGFDPERVAAIVRERTQAEFSSAVLTWYSAPALIADVWREAWCSKNAAAQNAGEWLFCQASNDEEIMFIVLRQMQKERHHYSQIFADGFWAVRQQKIVR